MLLDLIPLSNTTKAMGLSAQALRGAFNRKGLEELPRVEFGLKLEDISLADNFRAMMLTGNSTEMPCWQCRSCLTSVP